MFRGETGEDNGTVANSSSTNSSSLCQHTNEILCKEQKCRHDAAVLYWVIVYVFILAVGLAHNVTLLAFLWRRSRTTATSQTLGIHLSVINVLFLSSMPLEICVKLRQVSLLLHRVSEVFSTLNIFSSPLLLASMCVERYYAVTHPVLYLRLSSRGRYRGGWVALVWALSLLVAGVVGCISLRELLVPLTLLTLLFFLVMLASLLGIVRALCQRSPAQTQAGMCPVKKKALVNVLAVIVPTVLTYAPSICVFPQAKLTSITCGTFFFVIGCLKFGVFIGPMFYLSRIKRFSCFKRG